MTTYAVGDIQGCFDALECVLKKVDFNPSKDTLWVAGDLVNRGPKSLKTLRYLYSIRDSVVVVLGNHDLHLLATAAGVRPAKAKDTLQKILTAPDRDELLNWLQQQPLLHVDEELGYLMCHAGIPPIWDLEQAQSCAAEMSAVLADKENRMLFYQNMYGDEPNVWNDALRGVERWRAITNYFTRMRFCDADGALELSSKQGLDQPPSGYRAWFQHPGKLELSATRQLLFGHWASLEGVTKVPNLLALDTGCVWGRHLTALNLSNAEQIICNCR